MKHYFTIIAILFLSAVFSQTETTPDEYQYLTEGYEAQIENGLEVYKENYELVPIYSSGEMSGFTFEYYAFKNTISNETKALFVVCKKVKNSKSRYLAIPYGNSELLKEFMIDYNSLGISMKLKFDTCNVLALADNFRELKLTEKEVIE